MNNIESILNYNGIVKILFLFLPLVLYYMFAGRTKLTNKFYSLFSDETHSDEHLQISSRLYILIEIAIFAVIIFALWDIFLVHQNVKDFGQWGDFFGGILNPILTFLTFVGLMITIILQQIELKESRVEFKRTADALHNQDKHMKIQSFENTFFKMLELHNNIVENLNYEFEKMIPEEQRHILGKFYEAKIFKSSGREIFEALYQSLYLNGTNTIIAYRPIIKYTDEIQTKKNHILGQYFRNLYQILKFIKKQEKSLDKDLQEYANILRAQLSSYELIFLFLNCFEGVSDSGKFKELLIKFSFLQHFPISHLEDHGDKYLMLYLSNGNMMLISKNELCQFYKSNKSAFDGNHIISKVECNK